MIVFKAISRQATALLDDPITSGSVGLVVKFVCSEEWAELTKVAVFRRGLNAAEELLTGDSCTVPARLLREPGEHLLIGLYGTDGSGNLVIPTVWADAGRILPGVGTNLDPTPEEQTLLDQLIKALRQDAEFAAASAVNAAVAMETAQDQAGLSESWAVGGTGRREGEDTNNSKFWAMLAQQGAEESGFVWFDIDDQTGEMSVTITPNLDRDLKFEIDENTGELEVIVYG